MLQFLILLWVYDGTVTVSEAIQRSALVLTLLTWTVVDNFVHRQGFWCYNVLIMRALTWNFAIVMTGWLLICACAHQSAGHWFGVVLFCAGHVSLYTLNKYVCVALALLVLFFATNEARFEWVAVLLISISFYSKNNK